MSSDVKQQSDALDWIKQSDDEPEAVPDVSGDIVLTGSLGIAEAEAMHQQFSAILDAQVDISINADDLSRVDAAGVQLLYALVKEAKSHSINISWASASDALKDAATTLGLSEGMGFGS